MLLFSAVETPCGLMKEKYYKTLTDHSNMPFPAVCPFPKGNYTITDMQIDETFFPKVIPTGENFMKFEFYVDKQVVYGVKIFTDIKLV